MNSPIQVDNQFISEVIETSKSNLVGQLLKLATDFSILKSEHDFTESLLLKAQHQALIKLAKAASSKDDDTGVHITRVGYISEYFCNLLNKPFDFCLMVRLAAPMHDMGKVGIPDSILKKNGSLTKDEREVMNQHTIIGEKILNDASPLYKLAALIALTHHEKYDGTGYPRGAVGDEIPLIGRIVAIVDFFDALTMDRCYRKAFSFEETYSQIEALAGTHFDPKLTEVFLKNYKKFELLKRRIDQRHVTYENILESSAVSFLDNKAF